MVNIERISRLIKERSELELNDPVVSKYWDAMTECLSINELETINYLLTCTEEELYWLSEVFDDISYRLQSHKFIECIEILDKRYPNADLSVDVKSARELLNNNIDNEYYTDLIEE
ncbi:hypothetical protein [Metabacillus fastidiosus]|uniref:hypothetical protein n=1 Tax=Metabacillus fastidiosus TaxID=1458 RepID=UPI003D2734B6